MTQSPTPPQTVGPFFAGALLRTPMNVIGDETTRGLPIRVTGKVVDGDGAGVPDAMVEVWQADSRGLYGRSDTAREDAFTGFGRSGTDDSGRYWFRTLKPGPVKSPSGSLQAPHLNVCIFARGLLDHLATRMYFSDEPLNDSDDVLRSIDAARRSTMIGNRTEERGEVVYEFDITLQGKAETVFFDPR
jgi:protocatechuate 3,4-dioxygenase, alpha subunit